MNIDTGIAVSTSVETPPAGIHFVDTVILPASPSTAEPGYFTVFDGKAVVVTAYGMAAGETMQIEKMLFTSGSAGGASSCACPAVVGTLPARVNAVTLCDFDLAPCTAIRIINVPGRYRVVDPLQLTDSDVIVTISYMEAATIPLHLLFGGS